MFIGMLYISYSIALNIDWKKNERQKEETQAKKRILISNIQSILFLTFNRFCGLHWNL